jgi:hypothetical protein
MGIGGLAKEGLSGLERARTAMNASKYGVDSSETTPLNRIDYNGNRSIANPGRWHRGG